MGVLFGNTDVKIPFRHDQIGDHHYQLMLFYGNLWFIETYFSLFGHEAIDFANFLSGSSPRCTVICINLNRTELIYDVYWEFD
uniref:CSON005558 protein n=1 Tax=Culicoides sonorensis TaxID=179676 RepID=A0A336LVD4_CULSO